MPVGAQGSSFKLYGKIETTENVAPTGNWDQYPCFSFTLGGDQELSQDEILSANPNADAADPYYGKLAVTGDARVPLDTVHFGRWLRKLMGSPTTSGSVNFTHVFKSGSTALPSWGFEKAFPDITQFERMLGARANSMEIAISDTGAADATIGLLAMQEVTAASSGAGTPVNTSFRRFQRPTGTIRQGGSTLGAVTGGTIRFTNNMQLVNDTVRSDNQAEGIDFGQRQGSGELTLRFRDYTQVTLATNGTATSVEYSLTIDANTSITFLYPRVFFQRQKRPVDGPRGISINLPFIAAYDSTAQCLLQVTLKNQVASY
ncbi:phage tail tube protein [Paracraurococcus ruber]|uniref:Phage tail protein n=1 Tax=Paracraurococcus ruber TaxID=77675 RepID=A0ABS1CQZ5_9PROT|nr:phage tail tube protein [Paracraurococcus ruber]MBK1656844.1 hypothetical protein [Paracraurococcus ruber]TDG33959.1 hypothetical protein E2C05_01585 [Paracraurococcus ruber]